MAVVGTESVWFNPAESQPLCLTHYPDHWIDDRDGERVDDGGLMMVVHCWVYNTAVIITAHLVRGNVPRSVCVCVGLSLCMCVYLCVWMCVCVCVRVFVSVSA